MSTSMEVGSFESTADAKGGFQQHRSVVRSTQHADSRGRVSPKIPETNSFAFAHMKGISDKLQSIAASIAVDDANRHTCAGTCARTSAQCVVHPLDTIKTRLQVDKSNMELQRWKAAASKKRTVLSVRKFRFRCRNLLPFGVFDAYRGVGAAFVGTIPVALIYFAVYSHAKSRIERSNLIPQPLHHLVAGTVSALASAVIRVPTDTIRHRVQAYLHPNWAAAVPQLLKAKGVRGFYAGFVPTVFRDVPEIVLQFAIYEGLRRAVLRSGWEGVVDAEGTKLDTGLHLLLGGISGATSAIFSTPIDVVKTTLQCGGKDAMKLGVWGIVKSKYNENPALLFNGLGPRMCQQMVFTAIFFTLFECFKHKLKPASMRTGDDRDLLPKLYGKRRDHIWKRQFSFQ